MFDRIDVEAFGFCHRVKDLAFTKRDSAWSNVTANSSNLWLYPSPKLRTIDLSSDLFRLPHST
jgi:hypothetical protein